MHSKAGTIMVASPADDDDDVHSSTHTVAAAMVHAAGLLMTQTGSQAG
jgi:hypothetical protein